MTIMLIAASSEPDRGWGGPIALLVAGALFLLFIGIQEYRDPSPTEDEGSGVKVNSQVSSVPDTDDTGRDTGWFGRIVERGGRRVRVVDELVDDELDLDLDDDEEPETIEAAVARLVDARQPYMEIVRHLMTVHRVSERTAKRRIREYRQAA
ncbi:hypothetical protein OOJ91_13620 [Micromonospora lupini]|uniref:hypothetical protein n=1 Tax=Micromonospora lupini TaxID=285679 RepID=UPI00225A2E1C|nr:hypothetical protein [Micromonospora lupini]MCX5066885.1 hypothetical protein [Micromonospora lupini]